MSVGSSASWLSRGMMSGPKALAAGGEAPCGFGPGFIPHDSWNGTGDPASACASSRAHETPGPLRRANVWSSRERWTHSPGQVLNLESAMNIHVALESYSATEDVHPVQDRHE
ncbi:unnamed protein product [Urochloa humidicola]